MKKISDVITKRRMLGAALWLFWALLCWAALWNANRIAAIYPVASLRYEIPIDESATVNARKYAAANSDAVPFWPTFWTEQQKIEVAGLNIATPRCLWFSGDGALVWPADFQQGTYPGPVDDTGCCISDSLAWLLWGNKDVIGYELTVAKQTYTVTGVFTDSTPLIIIGVGETVFEAGWQAMELAGMPDGELRSTALEFAQSCGLGAPATFVDGPSIQLIAQVLSVAPLGIMGMIVFVVLLRWLDKRLPGKRWMMAFVVLLAFALVLPTLLESLPPSFIPTRFSDYAFWRRLFTGQWERIKEWLLLQPYHIDLHMKISLVTQIVLSFTSVTASILLIRYYFVGNRCIVDKS